MGAARIEIFRRGDKRDQYPGAIKEGPFQVEVETTSTTATTAGSRHVVDNVPSYTNLVARVQVDEACYLAVGADPTAAVSPALSWLLVANTPIEVPVKAGDLFSFKDVA